MGTIEVSKGYSLLSDGHQAVEEAISGWSKEQRQRINFLLVYYSTKQDSQQVAAALLAAFPDIPMAGCSTAGEFLDGARYEGSLVLMGIHSPEIRWQVGALTDLRRFDPFMAQSLIQGMAAGFSTTVEQLDRSRHFAIVLQDGLSMREELVTAALSMQLGDVTLLGGSAGDDLQFRQTTQIINGEVLTDAAVVIMGESDLPFAIIKDQHYVPSGALLVVTDADVGQRRVSTLDGRVAAEVYAEQVGVPYDQLGEFDFGGHPLIYSERGEHYVRSIQRVEEDGGLTFYCAIEAGMLLELGEREHPIGTLQRSLNRFQTTLGTVDLMLVFSCILCKLETEDMTERNRWGETLHQASPNIIGFDTYGEQLNGLHINQTLVAIGFSSGKG
ncbi:MAG: hypothetical protein HN842_05885 [Gammaproteobacteria bacterium]|jgi:hypothetical protein|nr:hypothetical protein [Gammaproteobacteria bacterium]MBT7307727.1 hypothetical protein [Gammaproteobacteria bacterium]